ncbi:transcriptional regulator with XRE-family HTH domain [Paraburkholderia tropica]|uniref:XRE family transcriptional regulator n=1 Tax=Paraburkholderia tropica TaxID=92647 RepID=UPI0017E7686E|nr:XRE family transcriptional regulator [Paraburkholderia tropica]MBB3004345.1 transcriptional regulator with XRE-family HTH domain [Paraburkholderia tropica]
MSIRYSPPSPEDLRELKNRLGYTGEQMADLFGLAGNNQWRKYTGGVEPRPMSLPMLFLAGAMLNRTATVDQVFDWCRSVGAVIDPDTAGESQQ